MTDQDAYEYGHQNVATATAELDAYEYGHQNVRVPPEPQSAYEYGHYGDVDLPDPVAITLAGGAITGYKAQVVSMLGPVVLADDVPVADGTETDDAESKVPELIRLTVPRMRDGVDWSPSRDDHPLAANGQRLIISVMVADLPVKRGVFPIIESEVVGDEVQVLCMGMLSRHKEAKLVTPFAPTGTYKSALRELLEPGVTVRFAEDLDDRAIPTGDPAFEATEDRLDAAYELIDSWPARARMGTDGVLYVVRPELDLTTKFRMSDGVGGTVVRPPARSTRDKRYTLVVARGATEDGTPVQGVAYMNSGPWAVTTSFAEFPVPYIHKSRLLTTQAQCETTARQIVRRLLAQGQELTVEAIPDPRIRLGDLVQLQTNVYAGPAIVTSIRLPLVATENMQLMRLTFVINFDATIIEDTDPPPVVQAGTLTLAPVETRSWRSSGWRHDIKDGKDNTRVYQGAWDAGNHKGCAFYGTGPRSLDGATVTGATVKIRRMNSAHGLVAAQQVTLALYTQATRPAGEPTVQATTTTSMPTLKRGQSATITVPTAWAQAIVDGTAGGLGMFDSTPNPLPGSGADYIITEGLADNGHAWQLSIDWER